MRLRQATSTIVVASSIPPGNPTQTGAPSATASTAPTTAPTIAAATI